MKTALEDRVEVPQIYQGTQNPGSSITSSSEDSEDSEQDDYDINSSAEL
jgi:hypothetical protein